MSDMSYPPTKGERRDKKRKNRRKMRVDGSSVKLLDQINRRNAKKAREARKEYGDLAERTEDTS